MVFPFFSLVIDEAYLSGHPWILFYTERTLRTLPFKYKTRHSGGVANLVSASISRPEPDMITSGHITSDDSTIAADRHSSDSIEQDDSNLVDALSVAVSHVRISEPKRTRLCGGPKSPIREQCSSNMKPNNLCKAF